MASVPELDTHAEIHGVQTVHEQEKANHFNWNIPPAADVISFSGYYLITVTSNQGNLSEGYHVELYYSWWQALHK